MKNSIKITSLLIALFGMSLKAQSQQNRLIVPDIDVQYGEAQLPITVENTDEIKIAIKADSDTPYENIKKVMSELQDMDQNRYYLITSLKTGED